MTTLILGLIIFLGTHSIRIFAEDWRTRQIARLGELPWKGIYSAVSLLGFVLLVWGYGQTRGMEEWSLAPVWMRHLVALLTLPAFVLVAAAYVPGNWLKTKIGHPMLAGVKTWALAHLLVNGRTGDILLFGGFLLWSILAFRAARRRDRINGTVYIRGPVSRDLWTAAIGLGAWVAFALFGHVWLIGVPPLS